MSGYQYPDPFLAYLLKNAPKLPETGKTPASPAGILVVVGYEKCSRHVLTRFETPWWQALMAMWPTLDRWAASDGAFRAPPEWPAGVLGALRARGIGHITPERWAAGVMPMEGNVRMSSPLFRMPAVQAMSAYAHGWPVPEGDMTQDIAEALDYIPLYVWARRPILTSVPLPTGGDHSLMARLRARDLLERRPLEVFGPALTKSINQGLWTASRLRQVPNQYWTPLSRRTCLLLAVSEGACMWRRRDTGG